VKGNDGTTIFESEAAMTATSNGESGYLYRWPGLYVREGERVVDAPAADVEVARSYPQLGDKGSVTGGRRITLLTGKTVYHVGDEVRVIHVVEFIETGQLAYIMGPKPVQGEYVNDQLVTAPAPEGDPLVPATYNGVTLPTPAVDYNFDITSYRFQTPGLYKIQWRLGSLRSNVLSIVVSP
jgi:hypothetical protein